MAEPFYRDGLITLYQGNSTTEALEWLSADYLVTDPPYGQKLISRHGWRTGDSQRKRLTGDTNTGARDAALRLWEVFSGGPALVFGAWNRPIPANTRQMIVWDKRGGNGFSGDLKIPWASVTEQIYVIGREWSGRRVPAIYSIPSLHSHSAQRYGHITAKPVELMEALISKIPPEAVIADPFAGSGATLVAAQNLGRQAIGVELDEGHAETIAFRLSERNLL